MKEFLLNLLNNALESVGEEKLEAVLQKLHDTNFNDYEAAIHAGHAFVLKILPLVTKTGTKIDDAFLHAVNDAINDSAAHNGIIL